MDSKIRNIWGRINDYMNIEPDPDVARNENFKAVKLILLVGLLTSLIRVVMEKALYGKTSYEAMIGCGIFAFFLAFSFVNWSSLRKMITFAMEMVIFFILIVIAFVDYYPGVTISAFLFLILLVVLPR